MAPDTEQWSPSDELLDRFLANHATADECAAINTWLARTPEAHATVETLRQLRISPPLSALEHDALWQQVSQRMTTPVKRTGRQTGVGETPRVTRWMVGVTSGAAVLLLAVIMMIASRYRSVYPGSASDPGVTRQYTTTTDQQAAITLTDGTRVILAPNTILRLVHFGQSSRTVFLDAGEAYFTVARASGRAFLVRSAAVTTSVLGTEFFVQGGLGHTRVRVGVASGKVRVTTSEHPDSVLTLTTGQIGDLTDSIVQVRTLNAASGDMEWASGHLLFHHAPVSMILQTLSQWYGYQFRLVDPTLAQQRLTIGISTQSSSEALAAIELVLAVNLTVTGDTVTLTPQQTRSSHGTARMPSYNVWTPAREAGR